MADIFISYTKSYREWAFWIAAELKQLNHTPRIRMGNLDGKDIYA
jgi:hypothetical protein